MMIPIRDHAERLDSLPAGRPLNCEEFQAQMSDLLAGDIRTHEHLKTCLRCQSLLNDLQTIADAARQLLPVYEPGDAVWRKIEASLAEPPGHAVKSNGHLSK
jgi:hypothetical protein